MSDIEFRGLNELFKSITRKRSILESGDFSYDEDRTLKSAEISLLRALSENPRESVTNIASVMNLTKGAVSQTLGKLEFKGLVDKLQDPSNASRVSIALSFKGRVVIQKLKERDKRIAYALESQIINLNKREVEIIQKFLMSYNESLDKRL